MPGKLEEVLSALKELIVMPLKPFDPPPSEAPSQVSHHSKGQMSQRLPPLHPDDMPSRIARVLGRGETLCCVQSLLFTGFSSQEGSPSWSWLPMKSPGFSWQPTSTEMHFLSMYNMHVDFS